MTMCIERKNFIIIKKQEKNDDACMYVRVKKKKIGKV